MAGYFKVNGLTILNMEKHIRSFKMEQSIQELIPMGNLKDMAYILGRMDKLMKENGLMVWKMDQEFGEDQLEILTLDSGKMGWQMDMEYIPG